jgi:ribose 5-phosphate isomerase B
MKIKKIFLSGDHAGFKIKEKLKSWLENEGYSIEDCGPFKFNSQDDYPDFVIPMAKKVVKNSNYRGIIFAKSGQGEAIAANRIKNVRSTVCHGGKNIKKVLKLSREHNNSNVLSLGTEFLSKSKMKKAIKIWLETNFSEDKRHIRRLKKIERLSR